jgi:hypothetical protein
MITTMLLRLFNAVDGVQQAPSPEETRRSSLNVIRHGGLPIEIRGGKYQWSLPIPAKEDIQGTPRPDQVNRKLLVRMYVLLTL